MYNTKCLSQFDKYYIIGTYNMLHIPFRKWSNAHVVTGESDFNNNNSWLPWQQDKYTCIQYPLYAQSE